MSTQDEMRRLAALTWLTQKIGKEARRIKNTIAAEIGSGGRAGAFIDGEELGVFVVRKPSKPEPKITDEEAALSWVLEEFGTDGMVEMRMTEQAKKSVVQAVRDGRDVPGVIIPAPGAPVPAFTLTAEADELVPALLRSGVLTAGDLLGIEGV